MSGAVLLIWLHDKPVPVAFTCAVEVAKQTVRSVRQNDLRDPVLEIVTGTREDGSDAGEAAFLLVDVSGASWHPEQPRPKAEPVPAAPPQGETVQ